MRTALVLDWPSVDAPRGDCFSAFEWSVTQELMKAAGFKPDIVLTAHRAFVQKWPTLFVGGKVGGPLTQLAEQDRAELHKALQGYDIALTLGSHAMFCLTGETKIDTYRGTHIDSPHVAGLQVVPTYSPSLYARLAWGERPIVVSAMRKATKRFVDSPKKIYLPETVQDLYDYAATNIKNEMIFDVETNIKGRITEFGLSPTSSECLFVQLETRMHKHIWSLEDEIKIFLWLHELAGRTDLSWGFHSAVYDLSYLDAYGIHPLGPIFDTMLRAHAYQPEWEKSLGFLAAMHVPGRAWKYLRTKASKEFNKAGAL